LLHGAADVFNKGNKSSRKFGNKIDDLHRKMGELKVDNDFLSRKLGF
jgi:hypothetical protein